MPKMEIYSLGEHSCRGGVQRSIQTPRLAEHITQMETQKEEEQNSTWETVETGESACPTPPPIQDSRERPGHTHHVRVGDPRRGNAHPSCVSAHPGPGSKAGQKGGRGCHSRLGTAPPPDLPPGGGAGCNGRSISSFQRLRLMDVGIRARPPSAARLGTRRPGKGALSQAPWPSPPRARGLGSVQGLGRLSGPGRPCSVAGAAVSGSGKARTRALAAGSQEPRVRCFVNLLGVSVSRSGRWGRAKTRRSPRKRTHHHGGDRLARNVGHLDPTLVAQPHSQKPAEEFLRPRPRCLTKAALLGPPPHE
ncbi:uncharacterized protein LOC118153673 isoform X1 [Callithrix jacchus]|uniref:uncharacterized protein LOC118153673 isoform X1 n=1 Tax=Callithrix jacchus TaxID=9483 RepID=UPI00159D1150|nr:uncharacterized protein LOC118153673 isoform X1 [Callithrix jacchus]